jgi:homocysteine S-methyltransferase
MLDTIERMAAVTKRKLSAQPNAGQPRDVEGRNIYLCSPEYMASYARRFILHNVRMVGGCCGTTPEHIRQIKAAVRAMAPAVMRSSDAAHAPVRPGSGLATGIRPLPAIASPPVAREHKSRLANARRGTFVVGVELRRAAAAIKPSRSSSARRPKTGGVDANNIP